MTYNRSLILWMIFSFLFLQTLKHGVQIFRLTFKNPTITFITPTPSVIEEMTVDLTYSRTGVWPTWAALFSYVSHSLLSCTFCISGFSIRVVTFFLVQDTLLSHILRPTHPQI